MAGVGRVRLGSPAYGAGRAARVPDQEGREASRRHVGRLMGGTDVRPRRPPPSPSEPARHSGRLGCPSRGRAVSSPSQARSAGVACAQVGGRHTCPTAAIGWHGRHVVSRRLSDAMKADEVARCAEDAFGGHGMPPATSSGQGSAFGSGGCAGPLGTRRVAQPMGGKGRWGDGVLAERRSRAPKSERLGAAGYPVPAGPERLTSGFATCCNDRRTHRPPDHETPSPWYFTGITTKAA